MSWMTARPPTAAAVPPGADSVVPASSTGSANLVPSPRAIGVLALFAGYLGGLELLHAAIGFEPLTVGLLQFVPYCVLLAWLALSRRPLGVAGRPALLIVVFLVCVFAVLGLHVTKALPVLKGVAWIGPDSPVRNQIASFAILVGLATFPAACYYMIADLHRAKADQDCQVARQREAEQALLFQKVLLEAQLEASLDGILTVDERRGVVSANRRFLELWGVPSESVGSGPDQPLLALLGERVSDAPGFLARIEEIYRHQELKALERVELKDGRTLERYTAPVGGEGGRYFGRTWLFRDISERLKAEVELRRLFEQTRFDAEAKTELLREVNHRVKNNLIGILGLIQAQERHLPGREAPSPVGNALGDLALQVRGLIEVHHLLSETQWSPMYLSELAHRIITAATGSVEPGRRIGLEVEPSAVLVSPRQANGAALVLNELATNTLKHAAPGRPTIHIAVRIVRDGEYQRLEYRDDGLGFPPEVLEGRRQGVGLVLLKQLASGTFRGSLALSNEGGAVVSIRIRLDDVTRT